MYFTDILQTAFDLSRAYLSVHVPYLYRVAERTLHGLPRPTARYLPTLVCQDCRGCLGVALLEISIRNCQPKTEKETNKNSGAKTLAY